MSDIFSQKTGTGLRIIVLSVDFFIDTALSADAIFNTVLSRVAEGLALRSHGNRFGGDFPAGKRCQFQRNIPEDETARLPA